MGSGGLNMIAAMATPAVLMLASAMLILSTNQRLQAILERIREVEETLAGTEVGLGIRDRGMLRELLTVHASRARSAHRALLSFYGSVAAFVVMVVGVGLSDTGLNTGQTLAPAAAFLGVALLFTGAVLLVRETWNGIRGMDARMKALLVVCSDDDVRPPGATPAP